MQNNAPIDKTKTVIKWSEDNGIMLINWSSYNPYLNSIEQLRYKLKKLITHVCLNIDSATGSDDTVWKVF